MKLSKIELEELNKRGELANSHVLIAQALDLQKRFWLNDRLEKLGLDLTKKYTIDNKSGAIKEVKDEPKKPAKN